MVRLCIDIAFNELIDGVPRPSLFTGIVYSYYCSWELCLVYVYAAVFHSSPGVMVPTLRRRDGWMLSLAMVG